MLVTAVKFITGNSKDCLKKKLILSKRLIIDVITISYYGTEPRVEFNGSCLKQDEITFNHGKIVNIYIVHEISKKISISDYLALENCLFGAVSLTENADINKYKYSGYGVAFDGYESFSFPGIGLGKNKIMFGVDTSSFIHADNKKKYF